MSNLQELYAMHCLKNAKNVESVSTLDRAFHYGDGCFTTARIRNDQIELFDLHLARLNFANEKLELKANLGLIQKSLEFLKDQQSNLNGTIKIILSRGIGNRGYSLPDQAADVWMFYYPSQILDFEYQIIKSDVLVQRIGLNMPQLVGLKSLNRLEQVLLKNEADQKGLVEALVTDVQGRIVEGISSNCFLRVNDSWICPELRYNGVHGVMRAEILRRMQKFNISFQQRSVYVHELEMIQSIFFCNALHPMKIASCLNTQQLNVQPCIDLFHQLQFDQIC